MATKSWDRLPDEDERRFTQFQIYIQLGPTRTIHAAYRKYLQTLDSESGNRKSTMASGTFRETSVRYKWKERAEAWDAWRLQTYGNRVAVLYTHMLHQVAMKGYRAARKYQPGMKQWKDVIDTMRAVAEQLAPARKAGAMGLEQLDMEPSPQTRAVAERTAEVVGSHPELCQDGTAEPGQTAEVVVDRERVLVE